MPYQLLHSSKISLLLLFSVSDGEMGPVPLPPNPFPVPEAEAVAYITLTFPAPSSTPSFDSLPNCFSGEQDHTEQSQEDPGTHMTLLEAVLLNSCCRSVPCENDPGF